MSLQGAHLYMYIILCGTSAEGGVKDKVQFMNRPLCTAVFCPFKLTNALLHAQYTVHVVCEVFICLHITDASVVIAPSHDYTFENNVPNFTFSCSGNGAFILWTVDDNPQAHHMYSIKEYNTHPSSYHQMDLLCLCCNH